MKKKSKCLLIILGKDRSNSVKLKNIQIMEYFSSVCYRFIGIYLVLRIITLSSQLIFVIYD